MIVVDLICERGHRVEGWFARSEDVDQQRADGLLTCAVCGSHEVRRLPSAPYVLRSGSSEAAIAPASAADDVTIEETTTPMGQAAVLLRALAEQLQSVAARAEDVGEDFPLEARRIHFGDAQERAIRGTASSKDVLDLLDEGIKVLPVPTAKEDLH